MEYGFSSADEFAKAICSCYTAKSIADFLGINNTHVYRARKGDITPTFARAVAAKGFAPPPPPRKRTRFAADVSPELRDAIRAECKKWGLSNGDMLMSMWAAYREWVVSRERIKNGQD